MSNENNKDIVIECSPYGDRETEIINLKNPSYEIISMPNIFDYETHLDFFIMFVFVSAFTILIGFIMIVQRNLKNGLSWNGLKHAMGSAGSAMGSAGSTMGQAGMIRAGLAAGAVTRNITKLGYGFLFIVSVLMLVPEVNSGNYGPFALITTFFILLGAVIFFEVYDTIKINDQKSIFSALIDALFPSFTKDVFGTPKLHPAAKFGFFLAYWLAIFCVIVSAIKSFRMSAEKAFSIEQFFSPDVLLASYCFIKITNYAITKYDSSLLSTFEGRRQIERDASIMGTRISTAASTGASRMGSAASTGAYRMGSAASRMRSAASTGASRMGSAASTGASRMRSAARSAASKMIRPAAEPDDPVKQNASVSFNPLHKDPGNDVSNIEEGITYTNNPIFKKAEREGDDMV